MAADDGDTVTVHYTGKLEDGSVFDSSREREPFQFTIGKDAVIEGFQSAVRGQEVGDKVEVELEPDEAYGPYNEERVFEVPRNDIPDEVSTEVGTYLQATTPDGPVTVKVIDADEETVKLDGNHPLAGEKLKFSIEVLDIDSNGGEQEAG